jgi:hypothetical protein
MRIKSSIIRKYLTGCFKRFRDQCIAEPSLTIVIVPFSLRPTTFRVGIQKFLFYVTNRPTTRPNNQPTDRPTDRPTDQPTNQPTNQLHGAESFWQATSHSASQEIPHLLWNPKFHCRVHNSPPLIPVVSQMHPFVFPLSLPNIHSNIILLYMPVSSERPLPFRFSDQTFLRFPHPSHSCYIPHPYHSPYEVYRDGDNYKLIIKVILRAMIAQSV